MACIIIMNDWRRDERDTNYRERQVLHIGLGGGRVRKLTQDGRAAGQVGPTQWICRPPPW